jgi:cell pole-organizing protein PopZ
MGEPSQEPSMEEILASIKRVIAEDGRVAARPARGSRPAEAPPPEEDVLELSDPIGEPAVPLVSENAAAASRQSLAALSALKERGESSYGISTGGTAPLEAVVREMLKPMLKEWLDANLPEIIEQMVAREIARITGKSL